ncbi:hypothetical protein ACODNH_05485 [Haloarcula sp. NS06]|uniref:hypothetical protein n=1 Tax=Haloarcula sp. NS06 TaxID=3409688 RepID=UPI003DA7406E
MPHSIRDYDGNEVEVRQQGQSEDGHRLNITHPDGRRWICEVDPDGEVEIESTYRDGQLADVETPGWLVDELALLARPA